MPRDTSRIMPGMWYDIANQRMRELALTHQDLATALSVSRGAVGHYLNGRREPTIAQLRNIAALLGVTVAELLGESMRPASVALDSRRVSIIERLVSASPVQIEEVERVLSRPVADHYGTGETIESRPI